MTDAISIPMANLRDHDLLVGLNGKADRMADDIREIKNGTALTFDSHEKRLRSLEDTTKIYDPVSIYNMVKEHDRWIENFDTSKRTIILSASAIGGLIGFILSIINGTWPFLGK